MRSLNVVQVLPSLDSGGVERGTLELGAYLAGLGHSSMVISAGGRMLPQLEYAGIKHMTWDVGRKSLFTLKYILKFRTLFQQEIIDVVHVRSRLPAWIVYLAWLTISPSKRPALVSTVHGAYSVNRYSAVMTKGQRVIVISNMIRAYVLQHYNVNEQHLRLIYRGVDTALYHQNYNVSQQWLDAWNKAYPSTQGKKLLTLPARLTRWKGHEDFIQLLSEIKQQRKDVHALIVGEVKEDKSEYFKEIQTMAKAYGVADILTFTGHRDDLKEILAISSIVYSLSTQPEAFGRTTIEALSLGKPVIAYAHGGVAELLADMLPMGAVEVGNIQQVVHLTLEWLESAPNVKPNNTFTLDAMLSKTLAVYEELVGQ